MPDRPGRKHLFSSSPRAVSPAAVSPAVHLAALRLVDDLISMGDPSNEMATFRRARRESIEVLHAAIRFLAEYN